jgi:uncharacterized protein (DUF1810 family)
MDSLDLQRFVDAQAPVYAQALAELRAGAKSTHWMWFVFPQLRGLGQSSMAQRYGLADADEALAYWQHPLLGHRLVECTAALLAVEGLDARRILGTPDDLKFRSCMTLFARIAPDQPSFARALDKYFDGVPDARTLTLLQR